MSSSPLLPCKDPPLLHRLTLRPSSNQDEMDEDPRPLVGRHHAGGDRRAGGPVVPPRIVGVDTGGGGIASVHHPTHTPPVPARSGRWTSTLSTTNNTSSRTAVVVPPQFDRAVITLAGRNGPRHCNEYVDSPTITVRQNGPETSRELTSLLSVNRPQHGSTVVIQPQPSALKDRKDLTSSSSGGTTTKGIHKAQNIITNPAHEPTPVGGVGAVGARSRRVEEQHDSIYCKKCDKCKCNDCVSPRQLPTRWVCGERYECSARQAVEYCSCLCCVKTLFYHCESSEDNMWTADVPCACCERPHCCKRWTCMGVMSLCVPCLCLYWPLRALAGLCAACYTGCSRQGCQCNRDKLSGQTLTKTPLIDSESSSA